MDSRLTTILAVIAFITGLLFSANIALKYYAGKRSSAHVAHFRSELAKISADLGTSASSAAVVYSYKRGEPVKHTVDHMARQSGVPLTYAGTAVAKSGISYSGELAGALTNFCVNEGLLLRKTASGKYELTPK